MFSALRPWRLSFHLARLVLAGVLVAAALPKLIDPSSFAPVIGAYGLVPHGLDLPLAVAIPVLELVIAAGLVLDVRWSLGAAALLLAGFMVVLGWGMHLGLDVDCGCFGAGDPRGEGLHGLRDAMVRDAALLLCCGYAGLGRILGTRRDRRTGLAARTT